MSGCKSDEGSGVFGQTTVWLVRAKEEWICAVACAAESARHDGHIRWKCLKQLQGCSRGRTLRRRNAILNDSGELVSAPDDDRQRWKQHFSSVLNIASHFLDSRVNDMPRCEPRYDLDAPPSMEELITAISRLKKNKAGGKSGLLPELLLYGNRELRNRLLRLMVDMWKVGCVVEDWRNAVIVPIPKQGDLKKCDNWRGITSLVRCCTDCAGAATEFC